MSWTIYLEGKTLIRGSWVEVRDNINNQESKVAYQRKKLTFAWILSKVIRFDLEVEIVEISI